MLATVTGKILRICETIQIPTKQGAYYPKRKIVLEETWAKDGQPPRINKPAVEFAGDRCGSLDNFRTGQLVTVSYYLAGSDYQKNGKTDNFTAIRGYKIEPAQVQQVPPVQPQRYPQNDNYASDIPAGYKYQKPVRNSTAPDDLPFD